jgi:hypothetical protein
VDACHPVWGVELLYCCWLLVGQRFLVGVGGGRKRLNVSFRQACMNHPG